MNTRLPVTPDDVLASMMENQDEHIESLPPLVKPDTASAERMRQAILNGDFEDCENE